MYIEVVLVCVDLVYKYFNINVYLCICNVVCFIIFVMEGYWKLLM